MGLGKTRIGLVQINNSYSGQSYLPYSVGLLQAYVQKNAPQPDDYEFLPAIFSRLSPELAAQKLAKAHIVGFSAYVWNERLSLAVAKKLKEISPETIIVFGGPQIPDNCEDYLRQNPFIDFAIHGEGEIAFLSLLENLRNNKILETPSLSFINKEGKFVANTKAPRLNSLAQVPSPYLEGTFDSIIKNHPEERWIVVWETNRGCPFSCTYCDWGSATQSRVYQFDMPRLEQEIEWFAQLKVPFIFCADANFGMLDRDYEIAEKVAAVRKVTGYPQTLSVQNTKNATEKAYRVQKLLVETGLNKSVTISFQSADQQTLTNIKRQNISQKFFEDLQARFTRDQIPTYSDIIIGLPGETYDSYTNGVAKIIQAGQHNRIVFNNLSILPNAEMGNPEYQKKFAMEMVENEVVYIRGAIKKEANEISEVQRLVIKSLSFSREDWAQMRAFSWMTTLLHFSKVLQIPFTAINSLTGISYRKLVEAFSKEQYNDLPIIMEVQKFFLDKARAIQNGDYEFCPSEEWLGIYWPTDEYLMIKLCSEGKLDAFYQEARTALARLLLSEGKTLPEGLLDDAIKINQMLFKQPNVTTNSYCAVGYNIYDYYMGITRGMPVPLESQPTKYSINRTGKVWTNWDDWCREVIWYGNKSAAYLYPLTKETERASEPLMAGHH